MIPDERPAAVVAQLRRRGGWQLHRGDGVGAKRVEVGNLADDGAARRLPLRPGRLIEQEHERAGRQIADPRFIPEDSIPRSVQLAVRFGAHPQDRRLRSDALEVGQLERAHDLKRVDHRLRAAGRWWIGALRHGSWRRDREQQDNETGTRERHGTAPEGCDSEADDRLPHCLPWLELADRPPADYGRWLGDEPDLRELLRPFPAAPMRMWPISTQVNKPENDDAAIVEPIELAPDAA